MVCFYSAALGFKIGAHALPATAATNALDHQADIAKVQEWLGHANISTTRIYNHRKTRPEDSPTFNFVTSSLSRNPAQACNDIFCVSFYTGFHRYDVHNVACQINNHE